MLGGDINFPEIPAEYFDRILLDVPCSALGQRPSIKNPMTLSSLKSYPGYQRKFIRKVLLKKYLILYIALCLFIIFYYLYYSLLNKCNITYLPLSSTYNRSPYMCNKSLHSKLILQFIL